MRLSSRYVYIILYIRRIYYNRYNIIITIVHAVCTYIQDVYTIICNTILYIYICVVASRGLYIMCVHAYTYSAYFIRPTTQYISTCSAAIYYYKAYIFIHTRNIGTQYIIDTTTITVFPGARVLPALIIFIASARCCARRVSLCLRMCRVSAIRTVIKTMANCWGNG